MAAQPVVATINYVASGPERPYYYANAHHDDRVPLNPQPMPLTDGRAQPGLLDREGFALVPHVSAVEDFTDAAQVAAIHSAEIVALLLAQTGADQVIVTSPGIVRFSEASGRAGSRDNSHPARFVHVDATAQTSAGFAARSCPEGKVAARYAHYNVWRTFSGPPQDVPLAVCDARSVGPDDLIVADAIFDPPGGPEWRFDSWVMTANPAHRWVWFPDMTRDEALIFKSSDSVRGNPAPHVAFDNPLAPAGCTPRASLEMRAVAFWFA
ncbi:CmcJ/NvfI family oxidoreductase [Novosphingobium sp. FKTRR1]|uniref:CmcJ/NvfI family oxidoreductase n=1 Tax=Novosphingobium sp. FKTRR1 TaxID=2879118 RepID=UPI001CF0D201|nr:CmcJ/NvfI family oxidoreductase [Novosphingobium sp. FKTRR1]